MNIKYKNFFHKFSLLFLVALILYSTTVPKAQAENANIEIAKKGFAGVVGTVVMLEVAKDMGWKMTKDAVKKLTPKVKALVEASYDAWDFTKDKPKKNAGSLEVDVSAHDKAKMATILREIGEEVIEAEVKRTGSKSKPFIGLDVETSDPFYKTSVMLELHNPNPGNAEYEKGLDILGKMVTYEFTPVAFEKLVRINMYSVINDSLMVSFYVPGDHASSVVPFKLSMQYSQWYSTTRAPLIQGTNHIENLSVDISSIIPVYEAYLRALSNANKVYFVGQGLMIPKDNTKIYKIPIDTPNTYKLPGDLSKLGSTLKIPLANADDSILDLDFEILETEYELTNNVNNYETNYFNDVENTYNANTFIVNNYYTIEEGEKPQKEVDDEINIIIVPPGAVVPGEDVEGLNRGLIGFVKQTYEYLADGIDTSLESLKDITDSAMGVVEYLNTSMSWLPSSWRVMFGSAFVLGVVAHFLRR